MVLPLVATELLPGVIAGVMIAAVLAAICSTADSQLLVSASAISHDLYVRLLGHHPDNRIIYYLSGSRIEILSVMHYRQFLPHKTEVMRRRE
jgi:sodium/proline symporter